MAVAKVVAGGIAGLTCGIVVVWLVAGVDLLGQLGAKTESRQQANPAISPRSPRTTPQTTAKATPKTTPVVLVPIEPAPAAPVPTTPDAVVDTTEKVPAVPPEQPSPGPLTLAESVVALRVPAMPVRVRQQQPPNGIFLHPAANATAKITFDLAEQYRSVSGAAALNDSANGPALTPLTMQIVGDGRTLWTSKPIRAQGDAEQFQVDVAGDHTAGTAGAMPRDRWASARIVVCGDGRSH